MIYNLCDKTDSVWWTGGVVPSTLNRVHQDLYIRTVEFVNPILIVRCHVCFTTPMPALISWFVFSTVVSTVCLYLTVYFPVWHEYYIGSNINYVNAYGRVRGRPRVYLRTHPRIGKRASNEACDRTSSQLKLTLSFSLLSVVFLDVPAAHVRRTCFLIVLLESQ